MVSELGQLSLEVERVLRGSWVQGLHRYNGEPISPAEIAGRIVRIGFTDGAKVARGAALIELDGSVIVPAKSVPATVAESEADGDFPAERT